MTRHGRMARAEILAMPPEETLYWLTELQKTVKLEADEIKNQ